MLPPFDVHMVKPDSLHHSQSVLEKSTLKRGPLQILKHDSHTTGTVIVVHDKSCTIVMYLHHTRGKLFLKPPLTTRLLLHYLTYCINEKKCLLMSVTYMIYQWKGVSIICISGSAWCINFISLQKWMWHAWARLKHARCFSLRENMRTTTRCVKMLVCIAETPWDVMSILKVR